MLDLPISVLERVFDRYFKDKKNDSNSSQIIEFLFQCLDKFGRDASILFSNINFGNQSIFVSNRLIKDYSNIFDFNMINSTLVKTTTQLTSEVSKLKEEYFQLIDEQHKSFSQLKQLFNDQQEELKRIKIEQKKNKELEEIRSKEKDELFEKEITKMKEQNKLFEDMFKQMKIKQDEILEQSDIQKYKQIIKEIINPNNFIDLSDDSKSYIINESFKKMNENEENNEFYPLLKQISKLKNLFELTNKNHSNSNDLKEFVKNNIKIITLTSDMTDILYKKSLLSSIIDDLSNCFDKILIEINYQSKNFNKIFELSQFALKANNPSFFFDNFAPENFVIRINSKIKISIIISGVETIDQSFRKNQSIYKCILKEDVKKIDDYSFNECKNLTVFDCSSNLISIGSYSFKDCVNLSQLTIPPTITSIGSYAFMNCKMLTKFTIPSSVQSIESYSFSDCISLMQIIIPSSVKTIGSNAFKNCTSLKKITIPSSVESIESDSFEGCEIQQIECDPYKIKLSTIISKSSLTHLIFLDSVSSIQQNEFKNFPNLAEITISKSATEIGDKEFEGCSKLKEV